MSKARVFELSASKLQRMKEKNSSHCRVCDNPLKIGDTVCAKQGGRNRTTYRHKECARRVRLVD